MKHELICELGDLSGKACSITKAAADLMQADKMISCDDFSSGDENKQIVIWELLRTHDTCADLLYTLIEDVFSRMNSIIETLEDEESNRANG